MLNKKGIELSINFIVMLIIAIVIFAFGIIFIRNIGSGADEFAALSLDQLDKEIANLACQSASDKICIFDDTKTVEKGKFSVFGFKLINILGESRNFIIKVEKGNFLEKGTSVPVEQIPDHDVSTEVKPAKRTESLGGYAEDEYGIGINVKKTAKPGTYIYNVIICYDDGKTETQNDNCAGETNKDQYSFNKIYVEVD